MTLRDDLLELKSFINDCLEIVQKNEQSLRAEFERSVAYVEYFARRAEHAVDIGDFHYLAKRGPEEPEEVEELFDCGEAAIANINEALCKMDGVEPVRDLISSECAYTKAGKSQSWFSKNVRKLVEPVKKIDGKDHFKYSEISKVMKDLGIDWDD